MLNLKDIVTSIQTEGVSAKLPDGINFNFNEDVPTDQLKLFIKRSKVGFYNIGAYNLTNVFYAYYFTPASEVFDRIEKTERETWNSKINFIRRKMKDYSEPYIVDGVDKMIETSLLRFNSVKPLSDFETIIPLKSGSTLNDVIANKISEKTHATVLSDLIVKDILKNVTIDVPDGETSHATSVEIERLRKRFAGKGEDEFKSKDIKASFRRYVKNFLKYKNPTTEDVISKIKNKTILVVDDTLGEGATLREIQRLIYQHEPRSVYYYIFLKDY